MFEPWTETGSEYFACQDNGLSQITKLFVSTREKKILNKMKFNVVLWRPVHFWLLSVVQKRCMLELPNSLTQRLCWCHTLAYWQLNSCFHYFPINCSFCEHPKKCIPVVCNFLLSWSEWHQHIVDKRVFQWSHCSVISLFAVHNNLLRCFWNRFPNPYLQLCLLVKNGRGMLSPLLILP